MAKIEQTVAITGTLSRIDTNDTYPLINHYDIKGGLRQVADRNELNNISQSYLIDGMLVLLQDTQELVIYDAAKGSFDNYVLGGNSVKISQEAENKIENKPDGIYVNAITQNELTTSLVEYVRKDEVGNLDNIRAKVSREEGNAIEEKNDGLYVSRSIEWVTD